MTAIAEPLTTEPLWTRARAMFARAVGAIGAAAAIAAIAVLSKSLRRDIIAWLCPLEHVVRKLLLAEAAELHRAETERARRRVRIEHVPLRGMALHWGTQAKRPSSPREEGREEGRTTGRARSNLSTGRTIAYTRSNPRAPQRPLPLPPPQGAGAAACSARLQNTDLARPETWRAPFPFALPHDPRLPNARAPRIRALWGPTPPAPPPPAPRIVRAEDAPFRLARRFEALRRVLEDPRPHAERLARLLARAIPRSRQLVLRYLFAPCRSNAYDSKDPRLGIDCMGAAFDHTRAAFPDSS